MKVEVAVSPKNNDLKIISEGIQRFNQNHLPDDVVFEPDTKFAVFVKDEGGTIHGGVRATAFWNYCIIELLWLEEEARGAGIGSQLIKAAEKHAKDNGFSYIRTETLDFQAKSFYEKLGFTVFGELPDYPPGHKTYCLVKKL